MKEYKICEATKCAARIQTPVYRSIVLVYEDVFIEVPFYEFYR